MKLKEKLLELRKLFLSSAISRETEFNTTFENHSVGNQEIYRLYYVNYHLIGKNYGDNGDGIGMINWPCHPFKLPEGMTREEGFKVLSYLTDFIERREDIEYCSLNSVKTLDGVLDLERFGFQRVNEIDENKILNLFTVSGRLQYFKRSELYSKYFEWYIEDVTLEEVISIYAKYDMPFKDIVWLDNQNDKECSKVLNHKRY